jgi:hypothetical protein
VTAVLPHLPFSDGDVLPGTSPGPYGEVIIPEKAALIRQFFTFSRQRGAVVFSSTWRADRLPDRTMIAKSEKKASFGITLTS